MPITLDVTEQFAEKRKLGETIALRDSEGVLIAAMEISSIYRPDFEVEAKSVFGTTDQKHPGVAVCAGMLARACPSRRRDGGLAIAVPKPRMMHGDVRLLR